MEPLKSRAHRESQPEIGVLARFALSLTEWTERWVPDAFIFALLATLLVVGAAVVATPTPVPGVVDAWGRGFWELIPFTMQMSMVIITGYVLASAPPMRRLIRAVARWPQSPKAAVVTVALFAMVSSWFNWGFSLAFSAVLAREIARRVPTVDYRALAAGSVLGIGSIWAQGLSGSAALQMATRGCAAAPDPRYRRARRRRPWRHHPVYVDDFPVAKLRVGLRRNRRGRGRDVVGHPTGWPRPYCRATRHRPQ